MKKSSLALVLLTASIALFGSACSSTTVDKSAESEPPVASQSTMSSLPAEDGITSSEAEVDAGEAIANPDSSSTTDQSAEADSIPDASSAVEPDAAAEPTTPEVNQPTASFEPNIAPDAYPITQEALDKLHQSEEEAPYDEELPLGENAVDVVGETTTIYIDIPDEKMTPELEALLKELQMTVPVAPDSAPVENTAPEEDIQEESIYSQTTRTDAEVKETINAFVDNFKNTSTFSNLTGAAAEYVDENLNTIRNNPESNASLKKAIDCYKEGSYTEEMFIYAIEKWIRIAGSYGGQTITVQ